MSATFFVTVDGHRLECGWFEPRASVRSNGPTIVMLHEGLGSVAMWKDFPALLATATGCRVLAYSRYGYGRSDPLTGSRDALHMHEHEALVVLPTLLDRLEIARPLLFGHSDGASVALVYAGSADAEVAGLVVLAPHVMVEPMCLESIRAARHTYLTTDLRQKLARYHANPDSAFWGWNDLWVDPAFAEWTIERHLSNIACPILAIQGHQDEYATMEQLERIARAHPGTTLLKLEHCRHSPHRDQPDNVLAAVATFMDRLARISHERLAPGAGADSIGWAFSGPP